MTHQEILEKAIQRAIDGGWNANPLRGVDIWTSLSELGKQHALALLMRNDSEEAGPYRIIIFNHDFAKSIWKGNVILDQGGVRVVTKEPLWKHHLMMMVVDPNPLEYLKIHT